MQAIKAPGVPRYMYRIHSPLLKTVPRSRGFVLASLACAFAALGGLMAAPAAAVDIALPELGDTSSAYVSPQQERRIGQAWLRMFRSQVRTVSDPLLEDYLEHLVFDLAAHSQLADAQLTVVVVDNPTINAFAVPGGVVGIHDGLMLYAKHEDELASVIGHELAHLSQRHFARSVEEAKRNAVPNMLALLSSLVIAATAGGNAGMAAITASQAAIQQQQLRFSRSHEREADRIGMLTLVDAGYDANGMPRMFSRMLESMRYNTRRPPEFLLSHPVTESRVADAQNRARNYPDQGRQDSEDFGLMQARVQVGFDETPGYSIKRFRAEIEKDGGLAIGNVYGLVLALTRANELESARNELSPLLKNYPGNIAFALAASDIDIASGKADEAVSRLRKQLVLNPDNRPLSLSYADALLKTGDPKTAERVLVSQSKLHPDDPQVWYALAETHGLAGNIIDVHRARAEYFILNGALDRAERQLGYALDLADGNFHVTASVQARIADIQEMRQEIDL